MPAPFVDVAVVSAESAFRESLVAALGQSAASHRLDYELRFLPLANADALIDLARVDGSLQVAVIDAVSTAGCAALLNQLQALRPELDLFLLVEEDDDYPDAAVELVDRRDDKPSQLFRQVRNAIHKRIRTPFADTLRDYVYSAKDAWHTPGHSGGDSLRDSPWVADFYRMMGEHIFNTDLSVSVQSLDSLLEPHSVIQEAQDLAAEAFGARHTFFVTNGTSTANKVIVQHVLASGGKIIMDRACHQSVHHAVILFGSQPVYLPASVKTRYGFYGPVPKADVIAAIDAHPEAKLLVLTSCTYDGFRYDLAPIIKHAHQHGIRVLIDEAWYAHGRCHPAFRPNAIDCGADYVTQSTHKMLSAFSQASMIHVNDPKFDEHRFRENLNMHTSTSPQYGMIASLDVARKQASLEGYSLMLRCLDIARRLREGIDATGVFRVLTLADMLPLELAGDGIQLDPLKLSVDVSASGLSARQLQMKLYEEYGIQLEKITHNTATILVTPGATQSKVLRLLSALRKIATRVGSTDAVEELADDEPIVRLPPLSEFLMLPRDAYFGEAQIVELEGEGGGINEALVGRVSADQIVPYPPGIPVLNPGQRISREILGFLLAQVHSASGIELHGLQERRERPCLLVVRQA